MSESFHQEKHQLAWGVIGWSCVSYDDTIVRTASQAMFPHLFVWALFILNAICKAATRSTMLCSKPAVSQAVAHSLQTITNTTAPLQFLPFFPAILWVEGSLALSWLHASMSCLITSDRQYIWGLAQDCTCAIRYQHPPSMHHQLCNDCLSLWWIHIIVHVVWSHY